MYETLKGCPDGMTEAFLVTSHLVDDSIDDRIRTVSRPIAHSEVKIVDENLRILPINNKGEICVRGPNKFQCYYGDEDKTSAVKSQSGWFMTGDVGIMFDDGRIQHLGRKDDCIRMARNALKIYPIEKERHLVGHSNVEMCQAVAVPDEQFVNEICLCLVLRPGVTPTEEEIL
ncbi:medium-chain acyl-CoA ligase ACSF2, mitochondrial-like [Ptychodera flava]|uniref:medium-chain acyl-CoA ligase ACSF2, mitochondrial-like n=1 Tax=Ptychodera flava TaxID=63121 RepID=UPI00396A3C93